MTLCMKIRETPDCDQFQPDRKGALYFIKKSLKYGLFVKNGAKCIFNIIKRGGKDKADVTPPTPQSTDISHLASTATGTWAITKLIFKELGSFFLHLATFGIMGALRAAWNIMKLTLKIYVMVNKLIVDIAYNIGNLVGLALKAIKAIVMGRRRRLRK